MEKEEFYEIVESIVRQFNQENYIVTASLSLDTVFFSSTLGTRSQEKKPRLILGFLVDVLFEISPNLTALHLERIKYNLLPEKASSLEIGRLYKYLSGHKLFETNNYED